jgi:hypothetical protein
MLGVALVLLAFVMRPIADAVLKRLGERVAAWCLPDDHPASYRPARGICDIAAAVAPARSAARRAARGALSDIDELKRDQADASRALHIALSVVFPGAVARVRRTLYVTCVVGGGSVVGILATIFPVLPVLPLVNVPFAYMWACYALTGQMDSSKRYEGPFPRMVALASCCVYVVMVAAGIVLLFVGSLVLGLIVAASGISGCGGVYAAAHTDWVRHAARDNLFHWDQRFDPIRISWPIFWDREH